MRCQNWLGSLLAGGLIVTLSANLSAQDNAANTRAPLWAPKAPEKKEAPPAHFARDEEEGDAFNIERPAFDRPSNFGSLPDQVVEKPTVNLNTVSNSDAELVKTSNSKPNRPAQTLTTKTRRPNRSVPEPEPELRAENSGFAKNQPDQPPLEKSVPTRLNQPELSENPVLQTQNEAEKQSIPATVEPAEATQNKIQTASIPFNSAQKNINEAEKLLSVEPKLIRSVSPEYPLKQYRARIEGWVRIGFNLNDNGRPINIKVIDSQPKRAFNRAAMQSIRNWRYDVNGVEQDALNKLRTARVEFNL